MITALVGATARIGSRQLLPGERLIPSGSANSASARSLAFFSASLMSGFRTSAPFFWGDLRKQPFFRGTIERS